MIRESTWRSRFFAAAPRCDEPLSTIQNSRSLDRYGSSASTCLTSRPNGAIPVVGSHRPLTHPRRTSQAARYCRAPPRSYSFSIEAGRPGAGDREGWQRIRAWMLVCSSALRTWSLGPRNWPCHWPAYRSRIGPAFSAKWGSRGKIQYLYRHGLMASVSRIRHTVLRLIGVPKALRARTVTSARDCRARSQGRICGFAALAESPRLYTFSQCQGRLTPWVWTPFALFQLFVFLPQEPFVHPRTERRFEDRDSQRAFTLLDSPIGQDDDPFPLPRAHVP